MAAYSAVIRGASRVFVVDRVKERLDSAAKIGALPVNFEELDPVQKIIELNDGMVDRSVDAVGYQAVSKGGSTEVPNIVLENMIQVTRACGGLGIPGLYVPTDPGAPDSAAGKGMISLSFGKLFEKVSSACSPEGLPLPLCPLLMLKYFERDSHSLRDNATSRFTIAIFGISLSLARQSQALLSRMR